MNKIPWQIRSVVFDLDGLLIDTEPIFVAVAERMLENRGLVPRAEVIQKMMGTPARQSLRTLIDHYRLTETVDELSAEGGRLFFEILGTKPVTILPGALDLLDRLEEKKVPKAIATSSTRLYVERVLAPHRLLERFEFLLTCEDVRQGKPSPDIYEKAAQRLGHVPGAMAVLEDSPNGLRAAEAAGARCIVVPHDLIPLDNLSGADAVVPSLAAPELYELLGIGIAANRHRSLP